MRLPHPRIAFAALALGLGVLALTAPPTRSPAPRTVHAAAFSAPVVLDVEYLNLKALDQKVLDIAAWEAAAAEPPPIPEPPPAVPAPTVAKKAVVQAPVEEAPAQPAEAPPAPSGGSASDAVMEFFPDVFDKAWAVSGCESGHDPSAVSRGGGNWGLFQINTVHKDDFISYTGQPWSSVLDAHYNAMYARKLYDGNGGWGPWTCRNA